jgi:hypothetical protein
MNDSGLARLLRKERPVMIVSVRTYHALQIDATVPSPLCIPPSSHITFTTSELVLLALGLTLPPP